jgi:parallel beta-helix repeat protein
LRDAITQVNADSSHTLYTSPSDPSKDEINFAIGSGVQTITPLAALPALTNSVILDGTTQAGFTGSPLIVLNGGSAGAGVDGLDITGGNSTVRGLVIDGFTGCGIVLSGGGNDVVAGNYIGTDATGAVAVANGLDGVRVYSANNLIGGSTAADRNVISGNSMNGVLISASSGNQVEGNIIGLDPSGSAAVGTDSQPLGNRGGVEIAGGATNNTIGGLTGTPGTGAGNLISGNHNGGNGYGIDITDNGTAGNLVQGNLVGLDATGSKGIGSHQETLGNDEGIYVLSGATDNTIGGAVVGGSNIISNNDTWNRNGSGIQFGDASYNVVAGNFIGTDISGTARMGNQSYSGIYMGYGSNFNTVGGLTPEARNVISGNGLAGVNIDTTRATGNVIEGNYIGTDVSGNQALYNGVSGVHVVGSGNTVGGSAPGAGNLISGNSFIAVDVEGNANLIQGNTIGLNANGNPLSNADGVWVSGNNNTIGGAAAGAGNIIRNSVQARYYDGYGVDIFGPVSGNIVAGNDIEGNAADGVRIEGGASNNTIGGSVAGTGNVISGNGGNGVTITDAGTSGNQIQGNIIGLDATGSTAVGAGGARLGNREAGVYITGGATGNTVGGLTSTPGTGAGNVISGNGSPAGTDFGSGVFIGDLNTGFVGTSDNLVEGNILGLDHTGTKAVDADGASLANTDGVLVWYANHITISDNVISNNIISGVRFGGSSDDVVAGNYIGTDVTGEVALGNAIDYGGVSGGIDLQSLNSNILIGGTTPDARNIISGNGVANIAVSGASNSPIEGNYIGTDATGNIALRNPFYTYGILMSGSAHNNTIGGLTSTPGTGAGNIISGNSGDGVLIAAGSSSSVSGNLIGLTANGSPLGNSFAGVDISAGATSTTVGGTAAGAANIISANGGSGILVAATGTIGNLIRGNSIYTNSHLGIDLVSDYDVGVGVTLNDSLGHAGGNNLQNFPVLTSAFTNGNNLTITGSFSEAAEQSTSIALDFYANDSPDPSGYGQGQTYLGSASVPTDGSGNANNFSVTLQVAVPAGQWVTATATDQSNNTSEFSLAKQVVRQVATATSVTSSLTNPVTLVTSAAIPGQPVTFTAQVTPALAVNSTPTGSVDFLDTTTNIDLGSASLSPSGVATFTPTTPLTQLGTHVIQANYTPSSGSIFLASSGTMNQPVTQSIFVLNLTASSALSVAGTASINLTSLPVPGNIVVDSNANSNGKKALTASNAAQINANSIQVVGGYSVSGTATISPTPTTGAAVVADPLNGLTVPTTSGTPALVNLTKGTQTINPGVYSGITVTGKTASLTMNPGVYIIEGPAGFTVTNGGSVAGGGVLIYNTVDANGKFGGITLGGTGAAVTVNLAAPTSGPYAGIVIWQDRAVTRAIALGTSGGLSGTIYAKTAQLTLSNSAAVNGALVVDKLQLLGSAASTQTAAGVNADNAGSTAGELLAGNLEVYVNDPTGLFTADQLARIQDAVNAVDAVVEPYGISVTETTDATAANVTVDTGSTSAAGGYADGVLGCYTTAGEVTMIQGWNWYAGSDPTQIGGAQYDFETTVMHELGHAIGLGESSNAASAMNGTLATGTVIRSLTAADLNIPAAESGADAQHAAIMPMATDTASRVPGTTVPSRDAFFALLAKPANAGTLAAAPLVQSQARDAVFADPTRDVGSANLAAVGTAPIFAASVSIGMADAPLAEPLQEGMDVPLLPSAPASEMLDPRFDFVPSDSALDTEC